MQMTAVTAGIAAAFSDDSHAALAKAQQAILKSDEDQDGTEPDADTKPRAAIKIDEDQQKENIRNVANRLHAMGASQLN